MDEALSADLDKIRGKLDGWPELIPLQIPASMMRRLLEALSTYAQRESQNGDSKALNSITSLLNDPDDFTLEWVMLQIVAILKTTGRTVDFGASRDEWIKQHSEPLASCESVIYHGPGHQSTTKCQRKDSHNQHYARSPMGEDYYWRGKNAFSGAFNESPEETPE